MLLAIFQRKDSHYFIRACFLYEAKHAESANRIEPRTNVVLTRETNPVT